MPRLTNLQDVLFPVTERPVYVSVENSLGKRMLPVPAKKAIVNLTSQKVLGIVSRGYRLVTNREALDWAHECCRTVFPETQASEWEVKAIDAPSTGGHCQIDLVHNSTALDFSVVPAHERPDTFGPFIRVTNSYNALRALAFDVGFFRSRLSVSNSAISIATLVKLFCLKLCAIGSKSYARTSAIISAHSALAKFLARTLNPSFATCLFSSSLNH